MTKFKRRFIRLDEISQKTLLSKGDVLEAVEQKQMPLCGALKAKRMGAIHPASKSVPAIFYYEGVVRFTDFASFDLASSGKAQLCRHAIILEPQRISHWQPIHTAFDNVVSADFKLAEKALSQPSVPIVAYTKIERVQTLDSSLKALTHTFQRSLGLDVNEEAQASQPQYHLKTVPITVEPGQLRVDLEDIQQVFGVEALTANALVPVNLPLTAKLNEAVTVDASTDLTVEKGEGEYLAPVGRSGSNALPPVDANTSNALSSVDSTVERRLDSVAPRLFTHPIAHIVARVLEVYPEAKAITVWNVLRQDVNHNEFNREFDVDVLIESMTQDSLTYFGRGETIKTMSYESFRKNVI
ncbi:MAG: hypothetical protein AAGJ88_16815 [Pseudomonadota bacterium]